MKPIEALVLMFCAVIGVVMVGRRLKVPYPIALVLGGLCISLIPGLPTIHLNPELVFLVFLPPLLFAAAWFTSWPDFKANLRPIFLLAVGLVLFTMLVTGAVIHALIPAIPLAVAFAFGAIVSPPDAVAATAIAKQVRLPRRIVTVLEGESLVNDATGLVALQFALAAAVSGSFSLGQATVHFIWVASGGLALGLLAGVLATQLLRLVKDDSLIITVSLLIPYLAYLPAERLHLSGVLAAVAAGIYGSWNGSELLSANARISAGAVWSLLIFVFNCVLFILIGIELPVALEALKDYSLGRLIAYGGIASAVVILIRPVWVFPAIWLPRLWSGRSGRRDLFSSWRPVAIVAWSGMRGVVSLAAALALPMSLGDKQDFPGRELLIFLTFCVILSTLVFQGLSLPFIIRWLGVTAETNDHEERDARLRITRAALARLQRLAEQPQVNEKAIQRLTGIYEQRVNHMSAPIGATPDWSRDLERWRATRMLWLEALEAQRKELAQLRRVHQIDEELVHTIQRELDFEESYLRSWAL